MTDKVQSKYHIGALKSSPKSIEEYIQSEKGSLELLFWAGGKLRPFIIRKNHYQWVLFPVFLQPSYCRLALELKPSPNLRHVTAYAILFSPGSKAYEKYPLSFIGLGFHDTPAMASQNSFLLYRNLSEFTTHISGTYTIGVTTRDWNADVENVNFEVALLRKYKSFS